MKYTPWIIRAICCFTIGCATKSGGITLRMPEFWIIFVAFFLYGTVRELQGRGYYK